MGTKIVFIDRDGVINKFPGFGKYVLKKDELMVFGFVPEALKKLKDAGFLIYVISNQACVGKGLMSEGDLESITNHMLSLVENDEKLIDGVYYCIRKQEDNSPYRKPGTGLIEEVFKKTGIDKDNVKPRPFFIGDSIRDVKTAKKARLRSILVLSGRETIDNKSFWETEPDYICENLLDAVEIVLNNRP